MITRDEIVSMAREAGFSVRGETIRTMHSSGAWVGINDELAKFAELATSKERTARIEARQRLADAQEVAAKSGLAHRKAVQEAVAEAVADEREACAVMCEGMHEEDRPSDYADAIRARGAA